MSTKIQKNTVSKKILVVDDGEEMLEGIRIILEDEGYEVMATIDNSNIPKVAREFNPCLILLDYMMPGNDGSVITKSLKKDSKLSRIPVIIFSASQEVEKVAKDAGADDYISKPFNLDQLITKIEEYAI